MRREKERRRKKVVEIKERRYFRLLYFIYIFFISIIIKIEKSLLKILRRRHRCYICSLAHSLLIQPNIFFLLHTITIRKPSLLLLFFCLFRFLFASRCQFMLIFSSYILLLMKERREKIPKNTHTHTHVWKYQKLKWMD